MSHTVQHELKDHKPRSWWLVGGTLVIATAALIGSAIVITHRIAYNAGHAKGQQTAVRLTATCPVREGYHILACTLAEADYRNTCRNRWKGAKP